MACCTVRRCPCAMSPDRCSSAAIADNPATAGGTLQVPAFPPMLRLVRVLPPPWLRRCPWLLLLTPPPPATVQKALQEQRGWLQELELLRRGLARSHQARRRGGFCPAALHDLLVIADDLEINHGWDPLLVDAWLDRLGLWDQEL